MKIITTQKELDDLKEVKKDEEVEINAELKLNHILTVYGKLRITKKLDCDRGQDRYVLGRENSSVEAWENSSVVARGNSSVVAWENSSVVAWGNSSVEAWGNSSVEAWGNSSVVAWENSMLRIFDKIKNAALYGFSVCFMPFDLKFKVEVKSKYAYIQKVKRLGFFEREGIKKTAKVILYKRVSKDFKTQENTHNETEWKVGTVVTHKNYNPTESECGEGKFHACSRPYFCDEFRGTVGDKYIAIEIALKDLHEWKDKPQYPHKIGFRKGKVLREVGRMVK